MVAISVAVIAIVAAAGLLGQAIWLACGLRRGRWAAPTVGFAALVAAAALLIRLPGRALTAGIALAVAALAAAAYLQARGALWPRRRVARDALAVALLVGVAVALPYLVSGRVGILGVGDDNDTSPHLSAAWWLAHHDLGQPKMLRDGYPYGPHALIAALSALTGISLPAALDGLLAVVPLLTGWAVLSVLGRAAAAARWPVAACVALPYLAASYLAQGAFKETMQALFVLAFALALRALVRAPPPRSRLAAVPAAIVVAGSMYTYSYLGGVWLVATVVAWALLRLTLGRPRPSWRTLRLGVRRAAAPVAVGLVALGAVCAVAVPRMLTFADASYNHEPAGNTGNLLAPVPAVQALGVWFASDFRFPRPEDPASAALAALALAAAVGALAWWLGRRRGASDLLPPAALIATAVVYWQATGMKNPYNAAKGLEIVAPLLTLVVGGGTLAAGRAALARRGEPVRLGGRGAGAIEVLRARFGRTTAGLAAVAGAVALGAGAYSSFLALRDAPVGPTDHARQLALLRERIAGRPTLFLIDDDFATWELRGTPLGRPFLLYPVYSIVQRPQKPWRAGRPFDFDTVPVVVRNSFRFAVTARSPYTSQPPPNWRLAAHTTAYDLWEREGYEADGRDTLVERGAPGAVLDCATPTGRRLHRQRGVASVMPAPIVAPPDAWSGTAARAGGTATLTLRLPRGDWALSLQYVSREGLLVRGPGLRAALPANLERIGAYWPVGTVHVAHAGPALVRVTTRELPAIGRALGAPGTTFALDAPSAPAGPLPPPVPHPLGALVATRAGAGHRLVPLGAACGRYVDWYRLAQ